MAYVHILHRIFSNGVSIVEGTYSSEKKARTELGKHLEEFRKMGYGVSNGVVDLYQGRVLYFCNEDGDPEKRFNLGDNDTRFWIEKSEIL